MADTDRLAALVTGVLVDMEEDRLCGACMADDCEEHDEMPDPGIGCGDGADLAARLIAAGVTLAPTPDPLLDVERLARALERWGGTLHESGLLTIDGPVAARAIAAEYARLSKRGGQAMTEPSTAAKGKGLPQAIAILRDRWAGIARQTQEPDRTTWFVASEELGVALRTFRGTQVEGGERLDEERLTAAIDASQDAIGWRAMEGTIGISSSFIARGIARFYAEAALSPLPEEPVSEGAKR